MKEIMDKKSLKNLGLIIVFSILILALIARQTSPRDLLAIIMTLNPGYLGLAILSFFLYRFMEGVGFFYLFSLAGQRVGLIKSISYSFLGYFFSLLTPSGGGGQPGQIYYMTKDGIDSCQALAILLPFNFLYHLSLMIFALYSLTGELSGLIIHSRMGLFFYLGMVIQLLMVLFMFILIKDEDLLVGICLYMAKFFRKLGFLRRYIPEAEAIRNYIRVFRNKIDYLLEKPRSFLILYGIQALMLIFYYGIAYFVYRSLGFSSYSFLEIVMVQCLLAISIDFLPSPGSVGFTEFFMFSIYSSLTSRDLAFSWMALNRSISLYLGLIAGIIVIVSKNYTKIKSRRNYLYEKVQSNPYLDSHDPGPSVNKDLGR